MGFNKKKMVFIAAALAVMLVLAVFFLQNTAKTEDNPIKAAYLPATQSLPLFVAIENKMFEKEGLKVELVRLESPNQIIDSLIAGAVDAGAPSVASGITAIANLKKPNSIKIYALTCGTLQHLNDELLVSRNSSISSIKELDGKKLGIIPGIQFSTVAKKILKENGVEPSRVALIELPIPNQLAALESNSVDAVLTLEPTGTLGEKKGISRILVSSPMVKFVADPWCGGTGVVSAKFLNENPEKASAFIKVMRQAIVETQNNPQNRQYLVKYLDLPEAVAKEAPLPLTVSTENLEPEIEKAYQKFVDVFFEFGVITEKPNVADFLIK